MSHGAQTPVADEADLSPGQQPEPAIHASVERDGDEEAERGEEAAQSVRRGPSTPPFPEEATAPASAESDAAHVSTEDAAMEESGANDSPVELMAQEVAATSTQSFLDAGSIPPTSPAPDDTVYKSPVPGSCIVSENSPPLRHSSPPAEPGHSTTPEAISAVSFIADVVMESEEKGEEVVAELEKKGDPDEEGEIEDDEEHAADALLSNQENVIRDKEEEEKPTKTLDSLRNLRFTSRIAGSKENTSGSKYFQTMRSLISSEKNDRDSGSNEQPRERPARYEEQRRERKRPYEEESRERGRERERRAAPSPPRPKKDQPHTLRLRAEQLVQIGECQSHFIGDEEIVELVWKALEMEQEQLRHFNKRNIQLEEMKKIRGKEKQDLEVLVKELPPHMQSVFHISDTSITLADASSILAANGAPVQNVVQAPPGAPAMMRSSMPPPPGLFPPGMPPPPPGMPMPPFPPPPGMMPPLLPNGLPAFPPPPGMPPGMQPPDFKFHPPPNMSVPPPSMMSSMPPPVAGAALPPQNMSVPPPTSVASVSVASEQSLAQNGQTHLEGEQKQPLQAEQNPITVQAAAPPVTFQPGQFSNPPPNFSVPPPMIGAPMAVSMPTLVAQPPPDSLSLISVPPPQSAVIPRVPSPHPAPPSSTAQPQPLLTATSMSQPPPSIPLSQPSGPPNVPPPTFNVPPPSISHAPPPVSQAPPSLLSQTVPPPGSGPPPPPIGATTPQQSAGAKGGPMAPPAQHSLPPPALPDLSVPPPNFSVPPPMPASMALPPPAPIAKAPYQGAMMGSMMSRQSQQIPGLMTLTTPPLADLSRTLTNMIASSVMKSQAGSSSSPSHSSGGRLNVPSGGSFSGNKQRRNRFKKESGGSTPASTSSAGVGKSPSNASPSV